MNLVEMIAQTCVNQISSISAENGLTDMRAIVILARDGEATVASVTDRPIVEAIIVAVAKNIIRDLVAKQDASQVSDEKAIAEMCERIAVDALAPEEKGVQE